MPDEDIADSVSKLSFYGYAAAITSAVHAALYIRLVGQRVVINGVFIKILDLRVLHRIHLHKKRLAAASVAPTANQERQPKLQHHHDTQVN